jgi:hypothetical protein
LCDAMGGEAWVGIGILFTNELPTRLLDLLNVKYVLTSSTLSPEVLQNMTLLDTNRNIRVYQNLSYLPRAFIVHRVHIGRDDQEILDILQDPEFDPRAEIILEKSPPSAFAASATASRADGEATATVSPQATAEITRYDPNHVTVLASTTTDGFLFLSESHDAGWRAYVDGVQTEVYRADYAFRAVYLTAGQHEVEFVYTPRSFGLGLVISLLAALCIILLLARSRLRALAARVTAGVGTGTARLGLRPGGRTSSCTHAAVSCGRILGTPPSAPGRGGGKRAPAAGSATAPRHSLGEGPGRRAHDKP